MATRPADHRAYSARVNPIVTALKKLGYQTIMPDHPDADDDAYVPWMDAAATQLQEDVEREATTDPGGRDGQLHALQCVVGANIERLAELTGWAVVETDDVGQQLDNVVDEIIDLVQRIVERNESLGGETRPPAAQSTADNVPRTGRASNRPATPEDEPPLRERAEEPSRSPAPMKVARQPYPGLTNATCRRPMSGPWH